MKQSKTYCVKGVGDHVKCPWCKGLSIRYGLNKAKKQRFRCKLCCKTFLINYTNQAYRNSTNTKIINHLKESCGISSISRLIHVSKQTVLTRILKMAKHLKRPPVTFGMTYEIDEQHTYIQNKETGEIWITYAFCRETKRVVDFIVGDRTKMTMKTVIDFVLLSNPIKVYTDGLGNYKSLIPKFLHSTRRRATNHIERQNLKNRTDLKRLGRSTICYSKSAALLSACLRIYFWG
ncbi:MAG: IS1 family transposase [Chitinophagaceae bacterium]|nr:IS1 family transposase [Chitinophagaceae bacterium]